MSKTSCARSKCSRSLYIWESYTRIIEGPNPGVFGMRRYKDIPLWKDVSPKQWTDWKWQVRNRITDVDTLAQVINLTQKEKDEIAHSMKYLRMAITPYYASLMDPDDPEDPIRKQAVPTSNELHVTKDEMEDTVFETV